MSRRAEERDELTALLQALPAPEPGPGFAGGARRRYLAAIEARDRRVVLTGLAAAVVGLAAIVASLATITEPVALVAWLAEAAADLARWVAGVGVVVDLVPPGIWMSTLLGSTAAVLSLILVARARSPALVK